MGTMNISLPEEMRAYVDEQVAKGGYSTASEYIRELIRQDQRRKAKEALEAKLLEGLRSRVLDLKDEDWDAMLEETLKSIHKKNAA